MIFDKQALPTEINQALGLQRWRQSFKPGEPLALMPFELKID
jgi:hypothetical protein